MPSESLLKLLTRFFLLITASIFLLLADNLRLLNPPKSLILNLTTPVQFGIYRFYQESNNTFGFLAFWKSGYKEIAYLKQRNQELLVLAQKVEKMSEENAILKNQFAQTPQIAEQLLPARVIGLNRYLFLDKGEKDKVKMGQTVLLSSFLVGKISKVSFRQSRVLLPTDPGSKITVISSHNRSKGILLGDYGTGLTLNSVLQADQLDVEETLETWGAEDFPSGLLVGKIISSSSKESELFKTAKVAPLLDYNKLTTVFVLLN